MASIDKILDAARSLMANIGPVGLLRQIIALTALSTAHFTAFFFFFTGGVPTILDSSAFLGFIFVIGLHATLALVLGRIVSVLIVRFAVTPLVGMKLVSRVAQRLSESEWIEGWIKKNPCASAERQRMVEKKLFRRLASIIRRNQVRLQGGAEFAILAIVTTLFFFLTYLGPLSSFRQLPYSVAFLWRY